jgi:hypothetical protein
MISTNITLEQLKNLPFRHVQPTDQFVPIPHAELVYNLMTLARLRNWQVGEPQIAVSKDLYTVACALPVHVPEVTHCPPTHETMLGVINGNNGHHSLQAYFGMASKGDYLNGLVLGRVLQSMPKRKDYLFKPAKRIDMLLRAYEVNAHRAPHLYHEMKKTRMREYIARTLLWEAGSREWMPGSRVFRVYNLFIKEKSWRWTALYLYECFTKIVRMNPPCVQMRQCNSFRNMMPVPEIQFQV